MYKTKKQFNTVCVNYYFLREILFTRKGCSLDLLERGSFTFQEKKTVISQQELAKRLSQKWNSLAAEDKQVISLILKKV